MLIAILISMLPMAVDEAPAGEAEAMPDYAEMELFELCDRYDAVSERLASEFIATRSGATEAMAEGEGAALTPEELADQRKAFFQQVEAQKRYNRTRAELRDLIEAMGTRECPRPPMEFDPLIDDA